MDFVKIQGHFTYEKFRSNDYAVYSFKLYDASEKVIVVNGAIPEVELHLLYELSGHYLEHKKYGMQFVVLCVTSVLPNDHDFVVRFLKSERFEGIGDKTAHLIVDTLGAECLEAIRKDCSLLDQVVGLNDKKKQAVIEGLKQDNPILEENVAYFGSLGLSYKQILKIDRVYGERAIDTLKSNPYALVYEVSGIGFESAKKLAETMAFEDKDGYYYEAFLVYLVLKDALSCGNTYIEYEQLEKVYCQYEDSLTFDQAYKMAVLNRHLVQDESRIYHHTQFEAEFGIESFFSSYPFEVLDELDDGLLGQYITTLENNYEIIYDDLQKEGIHQFMQGCFTILTGGPGTGKTTVVKAMIDCFKQFYPHHQLACIAPTGRAAKRLKELCDCQAYTIHSLLTYDLETNTFGKNQDNPIMYDALIIDEASMIDNWLFYKLLLASKQVKKICIIGDEDQLPPVGPGQLLKDLIESTRFPCIRLDTIHRQKDGSDIINLSRLIKNGDSHLSDDYQEIKFIQAHGPQIHHYIADVVKAAIEKGYTMQDIQVLSCMYRGSAGIDNLNHSLQEKFNPHHSLKREIKVGFTTFREQDKILQLKNQAEDDVYNGDIGVLIEIHEAHEAVDRKWHIFVDFDGIIVDYTQENILNITLAYCVSVHKSQGSEYAIVILALSHEQIRMFQRKLLYTAITRAKKSLILVGDKKTYNKACETIDVGRLTTLKARLIP